MNPLLGRWISADPLAVHAPGEADLNVYAYVSGAVLKNVDPLGLEEDEASGTSFDPNQSTADGGVSDGDNSYNATAAESEAATNSYNNTAQAAQRTEAGHKKIDKAVADGDARTVADREKAVEAGLKIGLIEGAWAEGTPGEHAAIVDGAAARCGDACARQKEAFDAGVALGRVGAALFRIGAAYGAGKVVSKSGGKAAEPKVAPQATRGTFPENPADLLPNVPHQVKPNGTQVIQPSETLRIRAESHPLKPGETYSPRHHGQHYHVETRADPSKSWNNKGNVTKVKPADYKPGEGTGFLPGEPFPGE